MNGRVLRIWMSFDRFKTALSEGWRTNVISSSYRWSDQIN
jgi:hypothetical protein